MKHGKKALYTAAEDLFLELCKLLPSSRTQLTCGGHSREVSVPIPRATHYPSQRCIMQHRVGDADYGTHCFVLHLKDEANAIYIGYDESTKYVGEATKDDIERFFTLWHTYVTEEKALLERLGQ